MAVGWKGSFIAKHTQRRDQSGGSLAQKRLTIGSAPEFKLSLRCFHEDLERIRIRARRQHDLRRTFLALARSDGARKDVLEWVTHGPRGNIDLYTTLL